LKKLLSYGLLNDPGAVRDWANGLADLEYDALVEGFRKSKDHAGYMTLGQFRALCRKPETQACHRPYVALPIKPLDGAELKRRIAKMKSELNL
jgi:hypothetical protein